MSKINKNIDAQIKSLKDSKVDFEKLEQLDDKISEITILKKEKFNEVGKSRIKPKRKDH